MDAIGFCQWCKDLVYPYALSEVAPETCEQCYRLHEASFILAFDLQDGVHFTRGTDGMVEYWIGDHVLCAGAVWDYVHVHALKDGSLDRLPLADLALRTQRSLAQFHGPVFAPPFAVPEGDHTDA